MLIYSSECYKYVILLLLNHFQICNNCIIQSMFADICKKIEHILFIKKVKNKLSIITGHYNGEQFVENISKNNLQFSLYIYIYIYISISIYLYLSISISIYIYSNIFYEFDRHKKMKNNKKNILHTMQP